MRYRDDPAAGPVLATRIERLFDSCRPPGAPERTWRNNEVVAACRAGGRELSESHLSELRRGLKRNPSVRTLQALGWFFEVPTGYFTDEAVAAETERELARRAAQGRARCEAQRAEREEEREAARELQRALRESGVTRAAQRGAGAGAAADARERVSMMRALARALRDDDDADEEGDAT